MHLLLQTTFKMIFCEILYEMPIEEFNAALLNQNFPKYLQP